VGSKGRKVFRGGLKKKKKKRELMGIEGGGWAYCEGGMGGGWGAK